MKRRFIKDTLVYGAATVFSRGLSFLALPVYTRILAPADYGAMDMILVAGTFANLIVPMEISQALARFMGDAPSDDERKRLASTTLWFTILAYGLAACVALFYSPWITRTIYGDSELLLPMQIGIGVISSNGIFYLFQNQLRFEFRSSEYAIISIVYGICTVMLSIVLGMEFGLEGVLTAQIAAATVGGFIALWRLRLSYSLLVDTKLLRNLLRFSAPLVPSALATFLTLYSNRLALNAMAGLAEVGVFGVALRISGAVTLLMVGIKSSLTPLIYAHYQEEKTPRLLARISETFLAGAFFCCLAIGLFGPTIVKLMVAPSFWSASPLIWFLAPAALFSQMYVFFPGIALSKRTIEQLSIFAFTSIMSITSNVILVRIAGIYGAAMATLLSSTAFIVIWIMVSQRHYALPLDWKKLISLVIAFGIGAAAGHVLQEANSPSHLQLMAKVVILVLYVLSCLVIGVLQWDRLVRSFVAIARRIPFLRQG